MLCEYAPDVISTYRDGYTGQCGCAERQNDGEQTHDGDDGGDVFLSGVFFGLEKS